MAKNTEQALLNHDFEFTSDAVLNASIAAFTAQHAAVNDERLAMDSRRSLGPGKVRVTFRIVPAKAKR